MERTVNNKVKEELGMAVRRRRHKLSLSQEDFADQVGIHRTYVSSIELGKVDISINIAYRIATALKIPLSQLIKEAESNF